MKYYFLLPAITVVIFGCGCSTTISDFNRTERDAQTYQIPAGKNLLSKHNYVIETKGSGEIACINLGKKDGIDNGDKIDFYKVRTKNGNNFEVSFASGRVFKLSNSTAWVLIKNHQTAAVKENHFARLASNQSYSLGEKLLFPPRFFKKKK